MRELGKNIENTFVYDMCPPPYATEESRYASPT